MKDTPEKDAPDSCFEEHPYFDQRNAQFILGESYPLIVVDLLKGLLTSFPEDKQELAEAFASENYNQLAFVAHKIKGGASYCSVLRLRFAAEDLEKQSLLNKPEAIALVYAQLIQVMNETEHYLTDLLSNPLFSA